MPVLIQPEGGISQQRPRGYVASVAHRLQSGSEVCVRQAFFVKLFAVHMCESAIKIANLA